MNKTIIINMNGAIFHIEEDAYEILKTYMTDVKRHFYNSADSLEITTDIENRIAEMFTELLTAANKQVIAEQDVNYVIGQMGSAKDFDTNSEGAVDNENTIPPYNNYNRKLFRDYDDHVLGGVCAGLASYFDIETVWVRLAFAVAFFAGGTGLLAYIVLWVIVPKARTRADRMSMRGEPLDLQGFKRNFQEEMVNVKSHLANLQEEAKPLIYKTKSFAGAAAHHTQEFAGNIGRTIAKILAVIIAVTCCLTIASILISIIGFVGYGYTSFGPGGFQNIFPVSIMDYQHNLLFFVAIFFAVAIPLFTIMFVALSAAFNRAKFTKAAGSILLLLWLVAIGIVAFYSARLASEFKETASFTQTINLKADSTNTYHLKLNEIKYLSAADSARLHIKDHFNGKVIINDDDNENFNGFGHEIDLYIEKSDTNQPVLEEVYGAKGSDYENALMNARNTAYVFTQQSGALMFSNRLQVTPNSFWRYQTISLRLKVPLSSKLIIDGKLARYLRDVDFYGCKDQNKDERDDSAAFRMTSNGLQCLADSAKTPINDPDNQ